MKGVYALIIEVSEDIQVEVGKIGHLSFRKGFWVYVGSAQGTTSTNLENRLERHFRKEKKTHWHIDYLLKSRSTLIDALWAQTSRNFECKLSQKLLETGRFQSGPTGFGASDCKNRCNSHLLRFDEKYNPLQIIKTIVIKMNLTPHMYSDL